MTTASKWRLMRLRRSFSGERVGDFPGVVQGLREPVSRVPDGLSFVPPGHLTPIPMDEQISSLSAILLDDEYYQFVLAGRKSKHGMPSWVGEDRLIPLKAVAWLEMTERVRQGELCVFR